MKLDKNKLKWNTIILNFLISKIAIFKNDYEKFMNVLLNKVDIFLKVMSYAQKNIKKEEENKIN